MAQEDSSIFLRLPVEVRVLIYKYLLDDGDGREISIRNKLLGTASQSQIDKEAKPKRSLYYILQRSLARPVCETTYSLQSNHSVYPAILCASRKIREEASYYLYGRHSFHFGKDLEGVVPFLNDRTPTTRDLISSITLYKRGPIDPIQADSHVWAAVCRALRDLSQLDKLTIVIEGGRPREPWDGPQVLAVSDFRLLYSTRHESLEWVRELASVRTINKVEIVADVRPLPEPKMNTTLLFVAFSASIETTFIEFIRNDLGIPARLANKHMGSEVNRVALKDSFNS